MGAYEVVTERLSEVTGYHARPGGNWRCPAHEDSSPSLSVTNGAGKVLLHCHAGCRAEDVWQRLGLAAGDLFDEQQRPQASRKPRIARTYDYTDEAGELLYQVVRYEPKGFRQRRPDGQGGWIWDAKGVRKVLYRLPAVLAAKAAGEAIWVCEGEKDADAVATAGACGTCNPGGAGQGKWRDDYSASLMGAREVLVAADLDEAGRAHAKAVVARLGPVVERVRLVLPTKGADMAEHLGAGASLSDVEVWHEPVTEGPARHLEMVSAATITPRPVRWCWTGRIPAGSLSLLAGREGVGKSTVSYSLAADLTRGRLAGIHHDQPRGVIVAATEDSWEHTIVPRLMAHDADLERVWRVDVVTPEGFHDEVSLPEDLPALSERVRSHDVALVLLDPLLSRLRGQLDSHKDAEVRKALEPLVRVADETRTAVVGLIHVNKTASTDPLNVVMGSRAFTAVARSVLFVVPDPDEEGQRMLGLAKSNLGRMDLPSLTFAVENTWVCETEEGEVWTGRIDWRGETERSVRDAMEAAAQESSHTALEEAKEWLENYLDSQGGAADKAAVKSAGAGAGHAWRTLQRASQRLRVTIEAVPGAFPRRTHWMLPATSETERYEEMEEF